MKKILLTIFIVVTLPFSVNAQMLMGIAGGGGGAAASPYENFTTYTETDPNSKFTVAANAITVGTLSRNETAYIYKANAVGATADFIYYIDATFTKGTAGGQMAILQVSNNVCRFDAIDGTTNKGISVYYSDVAGTIRFYIRRGDAGGSSTDIWIGPTDATKYYFKFSLDADAGGGNGVATCIIYPSSADRVAGTNAIDTITVTRGEQVAYSYVFAVTSGNDGSNYPITSGLIENLDLSP